jgi:hypothetical protein
MIKMSLVLGMVDYNYIVLGDRIDVKPGIILVIYCLVQYNGSN